MAGDGVGTQVRSVTNATIVDTLVEEAIGASDKRPYAAAARTVTASQLYGFRTSYSESISAAGQVARIEAGREAESQADLRPWVSAVSGYGGHKPRVSPLSAQWHA